jgi:plastocyanin
MSANGNAMMNRFLLIGLLALPGAAQADGSIVVQKGRAFRPLELTIARNESVTFTNADSFIHQIYVEGLFDSEEKGPGENLNETFPRAGTFRVRCHIHPTMRMTVRVK